jgi:hypothetical protein
MSATRTGSSGPSASAAGDGRTHPRAEGGTGASTVNRRDNGSYVAPGRGRLARAASNR